MKKKNLNLQFFKFIYAWIIILFHLSNYTELHWNGGYFGVDFYLLVAGYFMFSSYYNQTEKDEIQTPYHYLKKRFIRLFPWCFTAFLTAAFVRYGIIEQIRSPFMLLDRFSGDIWEILMIKWSGMNDGLNLVNGPDWTMSSMCIAGFLIWACLYIDRHRFLCLFMPLSIMLGVGVWQHLPSASVDAWTGLTTFGTLRAWIVMCLSYYVVCIVKKMQKTPFNWKGKTILTATEVLIHLFVIVVMMHRASKYYQWMIILLFMIEISIAMSGHSYLSKLLQNNRVVEYLGELSMSLFLMHSPLIHLFTWKYDMADWSYVQLIPFFVTVLVVAIIHHAFTKWIITIVRVLKGKLRKHIISDEMA